MKTVTPIFLPFILAIIGATSGAQRAHAGTINAFTGTWEMRGASTFSKGPKSQRLEGPIGSNFTGIFSFNASISTYSDDLGCVPPVYSPPGCIENWSGTFSGGVVSFVAYNLQAPLEYFSTGTITGGSFSGTEGCNEDGCLGSNDTKLSFTSTWTNGWSSDATLRFFSCVSGCFDSIGTLSMTTITPEPGSMSLLGLGIVAVAIFVRRRVRSRSLGWS